MRLGVLGTGMVGQALGTKLVALGNEVMMGSRQAGGAKATAWAEGAGEAASEGTFAEAAAFGEIVINATAGMASLEALDQAGADNNLAGKVLIDVANPLDFSKGMPPTLAFCNDTSLGERIQDAVPDAKVVKSLNTINASVMVDPGSVPGSTIFVCGNHNDAKARVSEVLQSFGWPPADIVDLGDITASRATEMYLPLWLRLMSTVGGPTFSIKVVR